MKEKNNPLLPVFHPPQNPQSKTPENALNVLEILAWKLKFKFVLGRSQRVIREHTNMLQFWDSQTARASKGQQRIPPQDECPPETPPCSLIFRTELKLEGNPPKLPSYGTERLCSTVRAGIPKPAITACGCGKGGQAQILTKSKAPLQ